MKAGIIESKKYTAVALEPNTFIGGVATEIPDKDTLASKLNILESNISVFNIVGNDLEARIEVNYSISTSISPVITKYIDYEGKVSSLGTRVFNFHNELLSVYFPEVSSIGTAAFGAANKLNSIYIPKATSLGENTNDNDTLVITNGNCLLYCNPVLATAHNGGRDLDLVEFEDFYGNEVRYVSNFTAPDIINDLSVTTNYSSKLKLNFSPPPSVNGIDYYECYANGEFKNTIKAAGEYIVGLNPDTPYNIQLKAVDIFRNKSEFSNSVSASTNNTVAVRLSNKFSLEETSGNAIDDIGNATGTLSGTITRGIVGKVNNAYNFNTGRIATDLLPPIGNKARSFSIWFRTSASGAFQTLIEYGTNNSRERFTLRVDNNNTLRFEISSFGQNGTTAVNDGHWHNVIFIHNGDATVSGSKIFLDGVLEINITNSTGLQTGNSQNLSIAQDVVFSTSRRFIGDLDEVNVFNGEWDQEEITEINKGTDFLITI